MRRHPNAIKREQRAMSRARTALKRRPTARLDVTATTGGKVTVETYDYPADWPRCACGLPVLDGHVTCGKCECDEAGARRSRERGDE